MSGTIQNNLITAQAQRFNRLRMWLMYGEEQLNGGAL